MTKIFDTVLLLALPASGKSEVRRYLENVDPAARANDFHMGPSVQLDDYPYVHMMRRIDDELIKLGKPGHYFVGMNKGFSNSYDWGTLIELLNEDYADIVAKNIQKPASAGLALMQRMDAAARKAGATSLLDGQDKATTATVSSALESEARKLLNEKHSNYPDTLSGKTIVIEFSRGGPDGAPMPLPAPLGYAHSLSRLSDAILSKAAILYLWVAPEESRRKNDARTDPNDPGSILNHGVPLEVMLKDYGCDDIDWMIKHAKERGAVTVNAHGKTFNLPIARFDNRVDKTSFLRGATKDWKPAEVNSVHEGLKSAIADMK